MPNFNFSSTHNMLMSMGCDTDASFTVWRSNSSYYDISSATNCESVLGMENIGTCSVSAGCNQIQIPEGVHFINISARISFIYDYTGIVSKRCSLGFVVAKDSFNLTLADMTMSLDEVPDTFPVVYDWTIGNETCAEAQANGMCLCNGHGSTCVDSDQYVGYHCNCLPGYTGNPYLPEDGCKDIDECSPKHVKDYCEEPGICTNTEGSYKCECPEGFQGNGTTLYPCLRIIQKNNQTMIKIVLGLSTSLGTILLLLGGLWLNIVMKKRKAIKQKAKYFEQNGGPLLQQQIFSDRIFSVDELEEATNHFSADRILGQGGQGTVYKGMLSGGRIVAIKKSKEVDESRRGEFINEVVILSQINHRNIVKLLGCCLETEVPLLVYEFIPNGTLFHHIHYPNAEFPITWKMRLQIATDSASALAYLHTSSSIPIFHRDIKSSNILLDDKYRAKLSDFGTSRSLAVDQTHITTRVFGTFGYLDPEYLQSNQFTDKSDVYSFGVVLVELLTGDSATQKDKSLISWFVAHMEDSSVLDIVDSQLLKEGSEEELLVVANLAKQCLNLDGKQRPTMQHVLSEIEAVRSLDVARTNQQVEPKTKQALTNRTQIIYQAITSDFSTSTSNLESRSVDSAEVSLLFETTELSDDLNE